MPSCTERQADQLALVVTLDISVLCSLELLMNSTLLYYMSNTISQGLNEQSCCRL
jgi:hypothetical protein